MNTEQDPSHIQSAPGEMLQEKRTLFRKRWFWILLILFCFVFITGTAGSILLLGKAQDYPQPTIGIGHFSAMNSLMRKYRREVRRREKKRTVSPGRFTLRLNHREVNFLLDLGRCYAKPIPDFTWKAHFRKDGIAEIVFSRHLLKKIGLNGEVHIKPSFRDDRLQLKAVYFRLGRCVLDPGLLQKRLDRELEKMKEKREYKRFLGNVHSLDFHAGDLILILKDDSSFKIPLLGS